MKIGIDARFWNETGVGRYIRNLVSELQKIDTKNHYVLFVRKNDAEAVEKCLTNEKWKLEIADVHWHSLKEQLQLPRILESAGLDLMHFPYFSVPIRYKGPFIVTIHDLILHHFSTGEATTLPLPLYLAKLLGYKFVVDQAAKKAEKIIAVSHATEREILDHLHVSKEKIEVTYEGVDKATTKAASPNPYGKYFLHVGNVYPHKNAKRLVDSFTRLDLPETKLIFVGKKDYFMHELEAYTKNKYKPESFIFTGFVDDETLANLFQHALATVVPSLMEGFGLPVLEAMANKSIVLASDIPSLREVAADAAIYFDPLAVADISAKIRYIAESKSATFTSIRKKGIDIAAKFTWEDMAKKTLKIYESSSSL